MTIRDVAILTCCSIMLGIMITGEVLVSGHHNGVGGPDLRECYASFRFGLHELEEARDDLRHGRAAEVRIARGAARLSATLDLCFPADGDAPRPAALVQTLDDRSSAETVDFAIERLRAGWDANRIGAPWKTYSPKGRD